MSEITRSQEQADSLDTSADSTKLVIAEDSDHDNSVVAGFSGEQTVGLSKRRHASSDSSSLEESFENLPIEKNNLADNIFNSPTRKFSAKSNSKNRRSARSQKGTPLKKLKLGSSESNTTTEQLEDRQNGRPTKKKPAKQEKRKRKASMENVDSDLKNQSEERLAVTNEEQSSSSAERTEQFSAAKSLEKSKELTWSSLDESSDDATTKPVPGKSQSSATLAQTSKHSSDCTDSDLSDDALAEETLAIESDDNSQSRSTNKIFESSTQQIPQNTSNAESHSNDALAQEKLATTACKKYQENANKEIWKTPKSMKISKTKAIPSTIKTAVRERSVSPVESIASSRGRRSLVRKNLNFEASSDGSNTDDFFDETLSDFQPSSDSDSNIRKKNYRKKVRKSDSDSDENDHQKSKDVSLSAKKKRGPYKKKPINNKNEDVKKLNNSQKFVSEEVSSDSEKENYSMPERLREITNKSNNKKRREIERDEKQPKSRDKLNSSNAKAAPVSVSVVAASQENDLMSEEAERESADESIASSMSRKKLKRPWKIDLSESISSDNSDGTVQIETESVDWMKDEQPDLEFEKDKSVFDTIESSETDSDIEEVAEQVVAGKNKGVRKFSSWQKNKGKLLQEIVGWLPFSRNAVSTLIETLREKILTKEYDRIDELMKALMMKIAFKSKVRTAHGIEASMLAILVPVIFSHLSHLEVAEQTVIRQFEKEDQDAVIKYLVQGAIKRKEFNIEPLTSNLKMLTLEKADCKQSQSKILSDTIQDITTVFSKAQQKSRRSGGEAISSEDHQPNVDHHVLCLKFQLDYLQVQTDKDAHALAQKIVAKVENSASHQRVGLQALNSIMNKLQENHQIGEDLIDRWYAVLAETSYTGARKQARRRMKMEILQNEFKNNKNSDAGFSLAKEFAENGQVVKSLETFLDYWGRNREKCDYSLVVWEFLRSLLNEKEAFEWLKRYGAFGSPVQFRKILLKFTSVHPVEIISLKKEIRELF